MAKIKPRKRARRKHTLIVSNEKKPKIPLRPGMTLDVVSVKLAGPTLKAAKPMAARLCGGTNTCLALVETEIPLESEGFNPR
jgi:hypothetical protein